jgi:uncharacterized surface protein with fasciclin (FAS1) repeats
MGQILLLEDPMKILTAAAVVALLLPLTPGEARVLAQAAQMNPQAGTESVPIRDPDLTQFTAAVKAAGIYDLFVGTGPFTVFAPSNAAFDKLGKKKVDELLLPQNKDQLTEILINHVVPGKYLTNTLKTESLKSIGGKELKVGKTNGEITVNGAKVVRTDLVGSNGVIHIIDTVLTP